MSGDKPESNPSPEKANADSGRTFAREIFQNSKEQVMGALNELRDQVIGKLPTDFGNLEINTNDYRPKKDGIFPGNEKDTYVDYKDGLEQSMRFKNGAEITFARNNPDKPEEITALEIKNPNQTTIKLTRVEGRENAFTDGKNTWNVNYETEDGKLIVRDFNKNIVTTRTIDGADIVLDTKTGIETTKIDGNITEIKDPKRNYLWQHQSDDSWQATALDPSKDFKAPEQNVDGKFEKQANGDYIFLGKDGIRHRFRADGSEDHPGSMADLRKKIEASNILNAEQKERLLKDYLPKFEARQFIGKNSEESNRERNEAIFHLSTLLDTPQAGAYSDTERGKILEQTAFHFANPTNFTQFLETCNATDIGICLLHESPSQFARVMAEVGNTGKFRTADGSYIVPPRVEIQEALRDQKFPLHPTDPAASGVSRAFGIIAANIHWQRRTTDARGNIVPKGSLSYQQSKGEGIFLHSNGKYFRINDSQNLPVRLNLLHNETLVDIMQQITGEAERNRIINTRAFIVHSPPPYKEATKHRELLTTINTIEDLHKALSVNRPQILSVHTGNPPFYYDSGYGNQPGAGGQNGGWHAVAKIKYEPVYDANNNLDPKKSRIHVDNSWNPERADRLTPQRAISLEEMYNALYEPQYVRYYNQQTRTYDLHLVPRK